VQCVFLRFSALKDERGISVLNFKKIVGVVVVFSLVLCSCGGNKNKGGAGADGRGTNVPELVVRNVQVIISKNGDDDSIKSDVFTEGVAVNLNSWYTGCSYDDKADELVCTNKVSNSPTRVGDILDMLLVMVRFNLIKGPRKRYVSLKVAEKDVRLLRRLNVNCKLEAKNVSLSIYK
jgi:hypothetical protein